MAKVAVIIAKGNKAPAFRKMKTTLLLVVVLHLC